MSDLPTVTFIEGEPPPSHRDTGSRSTTSAVSPFVAGVLTGRPGVWARIEDDGRPASQVAHKLRQYAETHGLPIEAVCSQGVAYARLMSADHTEGET